LFLNYRRNENEAKYSFLFRASPWRPSVLGVQNRAADQKYGDHIIIERRHEIIYGVIG
jgi:hypothetical protein